MNSASALPLAALAAVSAFSSHGSGRTAAPYHRDGKAPSSHVFPKGPSEKGGMGNPGDGNPHHISEILSELVLQNPQWGPI